MWCSEDADGKWSNYIQPVSDETWNCIYTSRGLSWYPCTHLCHIVSFITLETAASTAKSTRRHVLPPGDAQSVLSISYEIFFSWDVMGGSVDSWHQLLQNCRTMKKLTNEGHSLGMSLPSTEYSESDTQIRIPYPEHLLYKGALKANCFADFCGKATP